MRATLVRETAVTAHTVASVEETRISKCRTNCLQRFSKTKLIDMTETMWTFFIFFVADNLQRENCVYAFTFSCASILLNELFCLFIDCVCYIIDLHYLLLSGQIKYLVTTFYLCYLCIARVFVVSCTFIHVCTGANDHTSMSEMITPIQIILRW